MGDSTIRHKRIHSKREGKVEWDVREVEGRGDGWIEHAIPSLVHVIPDTPSHAL